MDVSGSQSAAAKSARNPSPNPLVQTESGNGASRKPAGIGLPCSNCHLYYPADLDRCPTCNTKERVSPVVPKAQRKPPEAQTEAAPPAPDTLEQEREEFLRQFKSHLFTAHAEVTSSSVTLCSLGEQHAGEPENAEVCKHCYDRLQERLDVCEGALHIDLKEAAQIIYDAVWADPSDPSKTYTNAANAILAELRKRAGISSLIGPFQSLSES